MGDRDKYSRVAPEEDDDDDDDESNYDDDVFQSLKARAVVELTGMSFITNGHENDEEFDDEF